MLKNIFGFGKKNKQEVNEAENSNVDEKSTDVVETQLEELDEENDEIREDIQKEVGAPMESVEGEQEEVEKNYVDDMASAEGVEETEAPIEKKGFFVRLKEGLSKTRSGITKQIDNVLKSFGKIDEELFEELEEVLITSDVGVETSLKIIGNVREKAKQLKLTESSQLRDVLKQEIKDILGDNNSELVSQNGKPTIILVMGVNGAGKTTTIGKLGKKLKDDNKKVLFVAADTFRAAAIEQLEVWGQRAGVEVIRHNEGSDPAAVIFDGIKSAKSKNVDVLICDTAGRLHNKKNLMEELKKISRVIDREYPEANKEVFLVLDSTTGQNALSQAKLFGETADITGLILTKLDGTAKGGIVIAIKDQMNIPVKLIGVGEKISDLHEFNPEEFANAMFDE